MPRCNLIIHYNILIMRDRSPPAPVCAHLSVCVLCLAVHVCAHVRLYACVCMRVCMCVCVHLGSVVLMSLKRSLKYCGARTMTCSEEEMDRAGSLLDSTTVFTKPSQSNYRQTEEKTSGGFTYRNKTYFKSLDTPPHLHQ